MHRNLKSKFKGRRSTTKAKRYIKKKTKRTFSLAVRPNTRYIIHTITRRLVIDDFLYCACTSLTVHYVLRYHGGLVALLVDAVSGGVWP